MKFLVLLFFFLLMSVSAADDFSLFFARNHSSWISAYDVEILAPEQINTGLLTRPPLVWLAVLSVRTLGPHDFSVREDCVFVRIPSSTKADGALKVVPRGKANDCQSLFKVNTANMLNNLKEIAISFSDGIEAKLSPESYALVFNIKFSTDKEEKFVFPLYNLKRGAVSSRSSRIFQAQSAHQKFRSSESIRKIPGVMILGLAENDEKGRVEKNRALGKIEEMPNELVRCHEVDDECRTVGTYECHRCRFGFFETVESDCKTERTKYCGINRCGEAGMPACPRGRVLLEEIGGDYCGQNSPAGFCQEGLSIFCDERNKLVCR